MARHDREAGQHRRWLEDARKYLGRGDLEGTLPALLRLPPPLREELLPRASTLVRGAVEDQHRRGAWGMLGALAARAEAEPALVEHGVEPEQARTVYWPLMWAAGRTREWARARTLWQRLAATVQERAPRLAIAVEAWLSTQGAPASEVVAPALSCLSSVDTRLGVEHARPRAVIPPPSSVAEVERAVLAVCALEPFPVFTSRIEAWARAAPAQVAQAVWALAGQLAARELWLRAAAEKPPALLAEPVLLLARSVRAAGGSSAELSSLAPLALRVLTARIPREGLSQPGEAEAWCALAEAAALQPDVRPWVIQAVSQLHISKEVLPQALRLYQSLLSLAPDAALWARAFLAWDEHHPEGRLAPQWLQEGLRQLLATQSPALSAWLQKATSSECVALIEAVAETCSLELVESWVEACWEGADEEQKCVLSGAIVTLMDRTRDKKAMRKTERALLGARSLEEAARMLLEDAFLDKEVEAAAALSGEGLRIWRRFAPRMLTYDSAFLDEAVRQASSASEAWEAAERYLQAHEGDPAYVEAMRALDTGDRGELSPRILARWMERRASNSQALAEAALVAHHMGLPCRHLHPLLETFLDALAVQPPPVPSPAVKQARKLAREHEVRRRKRKSSRKRASRASTGGVPRPRRKRGVS